MLAEQNGVVRESSEETRGLGDGAKGTKSLLSLLLKDTISSDQHRYRTQFY